MASTKFRLHHLWITLAPPWLITWLWEAHISTAALSFFSCGCWSSWYQSAQRTRASFHLQFFRKAICQRVFNGPLNTTEENLTMITHLTKKWWAFSSKPLTTSTSVSDFSEYLCSLYSNVSFLQSICSISCLNNYVKHMETKLAGGREKETACHTSRTWRRVMGTAPMWNCRDWLLKALQKKIVFLRYITITWNSSMFTEQFSSFKA